MFSSENNFQPFESKVWLSSPTMYSDSMKYVMEAYETNWMSTVGANINEVERLACEKVGCKYAKPQQPVSQADVRTHLYQTESVFQYGSDHCLS